MDTSPEYIKMCDCEEIQALVPDYTLWHKPYVINDAFAHAIISASATEVFAYIREAENRRVWLPRQDQLQEMVQDKIYARVAYGLAIRFGNSAAYLGLDGDASMEQLWLAFVMAERYQKTWDGEKWVKNDTDL